MTDKIDKVEEKFKHAIWIIVQLKQGDCWCEHGVGNPMYKGHSRNCIAIQEKLNEWGPIECGIEWTGLGI